MFTLSEVARVVKAKNPLKFDGDWTLNKVEFDSRLIEEGDLFVPLKGARDGHDFIDLAFEKGARASLSDRELETDQVYFWVEDVLTAFQDLAAYVLEKSQVDVLAITGSNGKTTTKDMLAHLLATTYPTYKTQGNYNNEIGLPYTILHMPLGTEKLVLEMGQDHLGDISLLSHLAKPKAAAVTIVAEAHLEFFKDRREIAQGKLQIADGMPEGALLLVPSDPLLDDLLPAQVDVKRFGPGGDIELFDLKENRDSLQFKTNFMNGVVEVPLPGRYNASNAMVAAYLAKEEGVPESVILDAFPSLVLTKNRTEWKTAQNGAAILSDVYNANPTAMRLILETFSNLPKEGSGRKLAVLADMKELGQESEALHMSMITSLNPEDLDKIYFYGQEIESLAKLAAEIFPLGQVLYYPTEDFEALQEAIVTDLKDQDQILLKGSNSMNLAKIVDILEGKTL
ncbi:UDP-N-acetylmuramoyl-tripeptide--D-alanyl-D-alanine ligase [Streptococcus sp. NLN64]|uniref:UDP-N-acetylmuramoyl-tripeptide--D-alanyl-D- alanine ligase n=1 Tax=Streptococcus sp. NLN64 TaxID=2822799 RepID=UPI0018C958F8|nr:UDP-N-acetylmuramoyl-tripeptide--D-alanyl-D-alanine ligase [Streptococcus sp. NLN64]MBG9366804.1 UDP-N-acetylmuramoyl-tripeptide--D-alanyl-D-alanine ligase [Streptococcus sp. NLN64]